MGQLGTRALGNRSILANAKHKEINTTLNKDYLGLSFMPFAPVILKKMQKIILSTTKF